MLSRSASAAQGVKRLFITDDDLARNRNWEPIFDRLIWLRAKENLRLRFTIQVDTQCHKIPRFIEKATRAGCSRVFLGMESVNPENLAAARKVQNHVSEYRTMLQAWRERGVLTYAGYILGFPADTPESIERDIKTIQRELPIDILEFFVLTPLPGSADHQALYRRGVWMDPDMNHYDVEHVTTAHPRMSARQWREIYDRAWHLYYSPEHVETLLRRALALKEPIIAEHPGERDLRTDLATTRIELGSFLWGRDRAARRGSSRCSMTSTTAAASNPDRRWSR